MPNEYEVHHVAGRRNDPKLTIRIPTHIHHEVTRRQMAIGFPLRLRTTPIQKLATQLVGWLLVYECVCRALSTEIARAYGWEPRPTYHRDRSD